MAYHTTDKAKLSKKIGQNHEAAAAKFLQGKGLKVIKQNSYAYGGEIDLICLDKSTFVFVEVRYRKNAKFGNSLESITPIKQQRLQLAAEVFLLRNRLSNKAQCRFDLVGIDGDEEITWLKNIFA